ncbi:DUF3298 and DUF4163 domain-containing protein [Algoriphagus hitonicola]|uniref:Deacetylase PdaC domain-containing protein n=1 Tax=Algoriphagus hitonicola TaxID=435880 RepID=A0A1I2WZN0_9BACT|nr:DUF4163 domain-containing protein [Algoriphagus hitonicola]SFH06652.1 Protein of unknown function [Algoriphagus hitonicola]
MKALLYALLLGLVSCQSKTAQNYTWEIQELSGEQCPDENCARVNLTFPIFSGNDGGDSINLRIEEKLHTYFFDDSADLVLEDKIEVFIKDFSEFKAEFPEASGDWELEVKSDITYQSDSLISVFFEYYVFTGGAHPNSSVSFLNFDALTGEEVGMEDLILDDKELMGMAEQSFREFHQIPQTQELNESNQFFIPESGFFLPQAMGFKDGKFWLIYSPYEIGPYAMGYTELSFELEKLKGIVRQ